MTISFNKNIHNVDLGTFGKKTLNIDVRLKKNKDDEWELVTQFVYVVHNDGKMSPLHDNIVSLEWLTARVNECFEETKAITKWRNR